MATAELKGKKVAFLFTEGVEQVEPGPWTLVAADVVRGSCASTDARG